MQDITVTGTVYDAENNVKANAVLTVVPRGVTGALLHNASFTVISDESGVVSFICARNAQYTIKGNVLGLTGDGLLTTMPDASSVTLESLVSSSLVSSTGLTVKSNGSAFASLIGTFDFSTDFTLTHTPTGEVNISIAAASLVNPMSALGDAIYGGAAGAVTRLAGNITTTRKFLRQTGDGAASAAPAWDTLVAGDIPNLSATYSVTGHNHSGVYELANANIQSHISNTSNPHSTTFAQLGSKPTTLLGYGITDAQPLDADLSTVAGLGSALQQLRTNAAGDAVEWFTDSGGGLSNPLSAGSVAANALQIVQSGTGLWQPATNVLGLAANGIEALRLNTVTDGVNYLSITPAVSDGMVEMRVAGGGGFPHAHLKIASLGQRTIQFETNSITRWAIAGNTGNFIEGSASGRAVSLNVGASSDTAPVYSFVGDETTGIGSQGTNKVSLIAGGVESGRFDKDATAGNTRFLLYDVDAGALRRVSIGAADSGGSGFKLLRVAN